MPERLNTRTRGPRPDKLMRDAILVALDREIEAADGSKTKRLTVIADRLVALAEEGNLAAIKEICDRADGKVSQPVSGDADNPFEFTMREARDTLAAKLDRLARARKPGAA